MLCAARSHHDRKSPFSYVSCDGSDLHPDSSWLVSISTNANTNLGDIHLTRNLRKGMVVHARDMHVMPSPVHAYRWTGHKPGYSGLSARILYNYFLDRF
jgi:hypothetical protein